MIYGILIIIIIIVPIGIAYYYDYKKDPKEFTLSIQTLGKGIFKGLVYVGFLIGLNAIYELVIPINKNHGVEFNSEREKFGIPKIGDNWENRKYNSDQFEIQWWNNKPTESHFKKVIEYGILDVESETDYYKNENRKGTFAWSKYDFENNTFDYFMEKPNDKTFSLTDTGRFKFNKPTIIEKVEKEEFNKYISE
ncbi:hypothetical protein [Winogradskyella sp. SM1960]|uniref:hypothetical protein n=1 Tax=Winogradskyella sp. SM1960 TaxID=2865955 RepID=UPI001CD32390|nr:hypothetical protein [Winogradskyella sp. SM1960]